MILNKRVSLVIPCRNEAAGIGALIVKVPSGVDEVVIVDNRSKDATAQVARKAGAVAVLEKRADSKGIGYGFAHQKGLKSATGDIVVTMDGDGTYPIEAIPAVVKAFVKGKYGFLSCNRFPLKTGKAVSPLRKLGVLLLNTEVRILYGYPMKDILSGMWVVDRALAKKLKLKEGGWDLSPEIKLAALSCDAIKFGEYHINHYVRDHGISKQKLWQTGFGHLKYIAKRRFTTDSAIYGYVKRKLAILRTKAADKLMPSFGV